MATEVTEHFTLDTVSGPLKRFRRPAGRFDPNGAWQSEYGVYTLAGQGALAGKLRINHKPISDNSLVLNIAYEKSLPGHSQQIAAELHCRCDQLSTPLRWTLTSQIRDRVGNPIRNTKLKQSAVAEKGYIEIDDGRSKRRIDVESGYTINWALFDAVQRLPRRKFEPLRFTMLDHFDQVKAGQSISYRETIDVMLGGRAVRLHGFDHLGEGIVPWVYWVDDRGRLLFAVSGLEGYLLNAPG